MSNSLPYNNILFRKVYSGRENCNTGLTHVEYKSWRRRVSSDVNIRQDVQEMAFTAGGESQPVGQNDDH
jgi:hypothetical protein